MKIIGNGISGNIMHFIKWKKIRFLSFFCSIFMRLYLRIWNIASGRKNRFFGFSKFDRFPDSIIKIGDNCVFRSNNSNLSGIYQKCIISTLRKNALIKIGNNCGFSGSVIGTAERIEIGNNVLVGANSFITDFDWHNIEPELRHDKSYDAKPVKIGDNVWVGRNCTILKGVNIGDNTIIGAQSVVTSDIPEDVIAAGNPCRIIKKLNKKSE